METISLHTRDGGGVETLLYTPRGNGPHPAIVLSPEGTGVTAAVRSTAEDLRDRGYVVAVPDFFRGAAVAALADPDDLSDLGVVMALIGSLDFRRATHDILDAVGHLRSRSDVDAAQVGVWGYCTGATVALLAAEVDPGLAAAVLFYPSQPRFDALGDRTPVHPIDLLWSLRSPTLLLCGDADPVLPPELLAEMRRRFEVWHVPAELRLYEGAGHAFCAPDPAFHHEGACREATAAAFAYLAAHVPPR